MRAKERLTILLEVDVLQDLGRNRRPRDGRARRVEDGDRRREYYRICHVLPVCVLCCVAGGGAECTGAEVPCAYGDFDRVYRRQVCISFQLSARREMCACDVQGGGTKMRSCVSSRPSTPYTSSHGCAGVSKVESSGTSCVRAAQSTIYLEAFTSVLPDAAGTLGITSYTMVSASPRVGNWPYTGRTS